MKELRSYNKELVRSIADELGIPEEKVPALVSKIAELVKPQVSDFIGRRALLAAGIGGLLTAAMASPVAARMTITDSYIDLDGEKFYPSSVAPYSAIVYKDNGVVKAEDWKGKEIARGTAGVDDASVIQSAIDALGADGGKIFIKKGIYYLDTKLNILYHSVVLEGEIRGKGSNTGRTVLAPKSGYTGDLIQIGDSATLINASGIRNLQLWGNSIANKGIVIYGNQCFVENCIVWYFTNIGIYFPYISGAAENWLDHVVVANNTYHGIRCEVGDYQFSNIIAANNGSNGILVIPAAGGVQPGAGQMSNIHAWGNGHGIQLRSVAHAQISNCYIEDNQNSGLWIYAVEYDINYLEISNVEFWKNNQGGGAWGHIQFQVDGSNISDFLISNCKFDATTKAFGKTIFSGNILGGRISNCSIDGTSDVLPNVEYSNVGGFTTKGQATITSGTTSVTVTHGLVSTPSKVIVTPITSLGSASKWWVANITSTSFDIVVDADPLQNVTFAWQAEV